MELSSNLKKWMQDNKEVAADADDATYRKVASESLVDGTLTTEMFVSLSKDPDADKASVLTKTLGSMQEAMVAMANQIATISKPTEQKARPTSNVTASMIAGGSA